MYLTGTLFSLFLIILFCSDSLGLFFRYSETGLSAVRKAPRSNPCPLKLSEAEFTFYAIGYNGRRRNIPWLGLGVRCNGCPPHGCEDDEAIIHGFCCGCAYGLDKVPVLCPEFLQCPLNLHGLCHDYEYMMNCCC